MNHFDCPQHMYSLTDANGKVLRFKQGNDCYLIDEYGKEYIDFWNGFGAVTLGYNDDDIVMGVQQLIRDKMFSLQVPTEYLQRFKDLILEDFPHKNQVGIFSTGTAAVRAATLAILKYTKKKIIISAGYHGWDPMWGKSHTIFEPNTYDVIDFYYIVEELKKLVFIYKDNIAALVISPDSSYFSTNYYKQVFSICRENNILIVIDDVKCGYRYNLGSSMVGKDLSGDIYVVSKGIANGARISSVIGNEEIMSNMSEFCFTSYYDVYSLTCAIHTLEKAKRKNIYSSIRENGDALIKGIRQLAKQYELPIVITGNGNLFQFVLLTEELSNVFYRECTEQGISLYKEDNQCPSYAFNKNIADQCLKKFELVFEKIAAIFPELVGKTVTEKRKHLAAYNQTDGCAEDMSYEEKIQLVFDVHYGDR